MKKFIESEDDKVVKKIAHREIRMLKVLGLPWLCQPLPSQLGEKARVTNARLGELS